MDVFKSVQSKWGIKFKFNKEKNLLWDNNMERQKIRRLIVPLIILLALVPVITADVIYYYQGTINVSTTSQPLSLATGPNGNVANYVTVTTPTGGSSFTATVYITNSTYDYYYQMVTLNAKQNLNLFVSNVTYTPTTATSYIQNAWLVIYSSTGSFITAIQIISNGKAITTPSTPISLALGTYYISLQIQPVTPLPAAGNNVATITVYFGDNVVTASSIPLPP